VLLCAFMLWESALTLLAPVRARLVWAVALACPLLAVVLAVLGARHGG
jgi:hypothetical protein